MKDELLKDTDIEDIENLIPIIENSFGFKFEDTELQNVNNFGELCDIVVNKMQFENADDCTTQQAFYKLREAISTVLHMDKSTISSDTELLKLFPLLSRRQTINKVEKHLGFKIKILRPSFFISIPLIIILFTSFIGLFYNWKYGLPGLLLSIIGIRLAEYFSNIITIQTVGQTADKMSRESYLKSRRNPSTVNKNEIEKKIQDLFSEKLLISKTVLKRDATFT